MGLVKAQLIVLLTLFLILPLAAQASTETPETQSTSLPILPIKMKPHLLETDSRFKHFMKQEAKYLTKFAAISTLAYGVTKFTGNSTLPYLSFQSMEAFLDYHLSHDLIEILGRWAVRLMYENSHMSHDISARPYPSAQLLHFVLRLGFSEFALQAAALKEEADKINDSKLAGEQTVITEASSYSLSFFNQTNLRLRELRPSTPSDQYFKLTFNTTDADTLNHDTTDSFADLARHAAQYGINELEFYPTLDEQLHIRSSDNQWGVLFVFDSKEVQPYWITEVLATPLNKSREYSQAANPFSKCIINALIEVLPNPGIQDPTRLTCTDLAVPVFTGHTMQIFGMGEEGYLLADHTDSHGLRLPDLYLNTELNSALLGQSSLNSLEQRRLPGPMDGHKRLLSSLRIIIYRVLFNALFHEPMNLPKFSMYRASGI
ncbi:hypothetical protein [Parendozoicomonas sp. Alg238-R29]|uniref:hypothetical protein n=1 Tax=Parendozoicomonas sp. Alg238-R29 TaxID=2993446 RepID=UPI00248DD802|nr:hypothetical protein [Parendozoicomonas sp. Alg238-R29]